MKYTILESFEKGTYKIYKSVPTTGFLREFSDHILVPASKKIFKSVSSAEKYAKGLKRG